ncbi:histone lysine acetyltransferase MYST-B [Besnoitia besnoiti]|uniref:Histone acetyltransferase n=1 Tax=Besnoitia besnoiti TaxID=94643 RepID=A0A2A9MG38_BESBE|nr:histone lysine acetyltransferase MYST-B [Besnoitia besnoiti]PFH36889.1 histone lysine acetyltransferase MYST-B [Besnoitia besnoiti]
MHWRSEKGRTLSAPSGGGGREEGGGGGEKKGEGGRKAGTAIDRDPWLPSSSYPGSSSSSSSRSSPSGSFSRTSSFSSTRHSSSHSSSRSSSSFSSRPPSSSSSSSSPSSSSSSSSSPSSSSSGAASRSGGFASSRASPLPHPAVRRGLSPSPAQSPGGGLRAGSRDSQASSPAKPVASSSGASLHHAASTAPPGFSSSQRPPAASAGSASASRSVLQASPAGSPASRRERERGRKAESPPRADAPLWAAERCEDGRRGEEGGKRRREPSERSERRRREEEREKKRQGDRDSRRRDEEPRGDRRRREGENEKDDRRSAGGDAARESGQEAAAPAAEGAEEAKGDAKGELKGDAKIDEPALGATSGGTAEEARGEPTRDEASSSASDTVTMKKRKTEKEKDERGRPALSAVESKEPKALAVNQWIGARLGSAFVIGKIISIRALHSSAASFYTPSSPALRRRHQSGGRTCPSCSKFISRDSSTASSFTCRHCGATSSVPAGAAAPRRSESLDARPGGRGKSLGEGAGPDGGATAVGAQGTAEAPGETGEREKEKTQGRGRGPAREEEKEKASHKGNYVTLVPETDAPDQYEYYIHYRHTNRRLDIWLRFSDLRPVTQSGEILDFEEGDAERRARLKSREGGAAGRRRKRRRDSDSWGELFSGSSSAEEWSNEDESSEDEGDTWEEQMEKLAKFHPSVHFSDHDEEAAEEHEGMDLATLQAHEEATKIKTIRQIHFGRFLLQTWYFSPYPAHVQDAEVLHVCEFCLSFFRYDSELATHATRCVLRHPPGDEIYRAGRLSVFEVDGSVSRVYSENLCFLAKLFLDHKTLQYDVEPFLFYVLTEADEAGCHLIGYFSKEKISLQAYNLACILTLPQHQRKGYGRFLISFSYLLSLREKKKGGPERPLSDLGRLSYLGWWTWCLLTHLESDAQKKKRKISIEDLVRSTAVREEDIQRTLEEIGVLRYVQGHHLLLLHPELVKARLKEAGSAGVLVHGEHLRFVAYHRTPPAAREALPRPRPDDD